MAEAKDRFYQRTKVINGVKYTAQFNGLSSALDIMDKTKMADGKGHNFKKLAQEVLDNVIVDPPGLTVDDFDTTEELGEVVGFGTEVANGMFRGKEDKGAAAPKG